MSSEQKQEQPEASQANMAPSSTEPSQETHTTATEVQKHDLGEVHTTTSEIKKIDLGEIQTTTETFTTYIEPESKSLVSKVPMSLASSQEAEVVLDTL